jgi:hypothetical protein
MSDNVVRLFPEVEISPAAMEKFLHARDAFPKAFAALARREFTNLDEALAAYGVEVVPIYFNGE